MILLQLHEKLPKNSMSTILWSFGIWSKLERWEMSISGCLISWLQIKKIILKCLLLLFYATTMSHFWIGLWHAMKIGFYMVMTSSAVGPRRSSKALLKVKFATTTTMKRSWSLFSGLLLVWFITAFWNLGEITTSEKYAQQTDERHWKLQHLQLALGLKGPSSAPRQRPTAHPTTSTSKVEQIGLQNYASSTIFAWQTTTSSSILTTFCKENASTTSRRQKNAFQGFFNSKTWIFMLHK